MQLLCFTTLLSFFPTVAGRFIETNDFGYNSLTWFVYLYFLGAYLAKYGLPLKDSTCMCLWMGLMAFQIAACIIIRQGTVSVILQRILACATDYSMNAIFPLTIAVAMLLSFRKLTLSRGRRLIRKVGTATLGIYLFHDNINLRGWLWQKVYRLVSVHGTVPYVVNAALSVFSVFALGCVIELTRIFITRIICGLGDKQRV